MINSSNDRLTERFNNHTSSSFFQIFWHFYSSFTSTFYSFSVNSLQNQLNLAFFIMIWFKVWFQFGLRLILAFFPLGENLQFIVGFVQNVEIKSLLLLFSLVTCLLIVFKVALISITYLIADFTIPSPLIHSF